MMIIINSEIRFPVSEKIVLSDIQVRFKIKSYLANEINNVRRLLFFYDKHTCFKLL